MVLGKDSRLLIIYLKIYLEEKLYKLNLELHLLFTDFKQAYDSINTSYLYDTLNEFWLPNVS